VSMSEIEKEPVHQGGDTFGRHSLNGEEVLTVLPWWKGYTCRVRGRRGRGVGKAILGGEGKKKKNPRAEGGGKIR